MMIAFIFMKVEVLWTETQRVCAAALSSCAHVKELTRTKQGQFTLQDHVLHEHQWTLEHILRSLHPCTEEDGQNQQRPVEPEQHQTKQEKLNGDQCNDSERD